MKSILSIITASSASIFIAGCAVGPYGNTGYGGYSYGYSSYSYPYSNYSYPYYNTYGWNNNNWYGNRWNNNRWNGYNLNRYNNYNVNTWRGYNNNSWRGYNAYRGGAAWKTNVPYNRAAKAIGSGGRGFGGGYRR